MAGIIQEIDGKPGLVIPILGDIDLCLHLPKPIDRADRL